MPLTWLWTLLRRQSNELLYSAVPAGVLCPLRHSQLGRLPGPCRADHRSAGASGAATELHCRKTSECEGRAGGETATDGAIFSDTARVDDEGRSSGSERDFLSTRPTPVIESQWVRVRGVGVRKKKRKDFIYPEFWARRHQVSNWKRWQCLLIVDEWHLCRLSILLLLLLELSKMSKLSLSILQILAWPASQHCQT